MFHVRLQRVFVGQTVRVVPARDRRVPRSQRFATTRDYSNEYFENEEEGFGKGELFLHVDSYHFLSLQQVLLEQKKFAVTSV